MAKSLQYQDDVDRWDLIPELVKYFYLGTKKPQLRGSWVWLGLYKAVYVLLDLIALLGGQAGVLLHQSGQFAAHNEVGG